LIIGRKGWGRKIAIENPSGTENGYLHSEIINVEVLAMNGTERKNIRPGCQVKIIQKQHQRTGQLTEGVVKDILTKSAVHHHGIKVRLDNGIVGRVQEVME
jgi:uncharacterized repeat protein (TIGR03833 family)